MVEIRLENVSKQFGKVVAVDNLNLEIKDGEFIALLGPSGCGKTTTLLMIAGIYKPTTGKIYFDDQVVNDIPPKDRNIGMVFQSYALYPHMSVFDNIAFPLKLQRRPKNEIRERVVEVAKILGIEELLDRKPSQLSGGQQQRVALARALVKEPQVFLMDEPLSNLDAKLRIQMRAELKRIQRELGVTTIYVTHDQLEAMTMADRIAVMNRGVLQQYASPEELYNKPANIFVASFIGSVPINFLEGELIKSNGTLKVETEYLPLDIMRKFQDGVDSLPYGEKVVIGIRPEHVLIGEGPYTGKVIIIEPLGRDAIVHIDVNGYVIRALTSEFHDIKEGDVVKFDFDYSSIHIFNGKSGELLI